MKFLRQLIDRLMAVPVFVKVMGIAMGIIILFGAGVAWQIRSTHSQMALHEAKTHEKELSSEIKQHLDLESQILTRELAQLMALLAALSLALAWLMTRILVKPLHELVTSARRVQQGDYTSKIAVRSRDDIGELAMAFNDMTAALEEKEKARQQLLRQVIAAQEEERKRVARELHDQTGQSLTSLIAGIGALEADPSRAAPRETLRELRRLAEETLNEVHSLSVALRPSVLDDLGLVAALQRHVRIFGQRFDTTITCDALGLDDERLPLEVELAIYRVVQESLTNAVRHGKSRFVRVLIQRTDNAVLTTVQDDGVGFDAQDWQAKCRRENRLGLLGIEERVMLLGGTFCVESVPSRGVTVYAEIPLREAK